MDNEVSIKIKGNRAYDAKAANERAGYKSTPKGYTWHHHQKKGWMQLVETTAHASTAHTGGFCLHRPVPKDQIAY